MVELKPCPFCGSEFVQIRFIGFTFTHNGAFDAGFRGECCDCCAITRAFDTEAEAAEAWNTRAATVIGQVAVDVVPMVDAAAAYWRRLYEETVLERRTCTNGVKSGVGVMPRLYCSNCGCCTTLNKPDNATSYGESFMDWPFYCGNCGAKVVD